MKKNRIITVLIIIAILIVVGVLGFLLFQVLISTKQTSNGNVQNNEQSNQVVNNISDKPNNEVDNNVTPNEPIIEPILNEITPNVEEQPSLSEQIVGTYYYSQLDEYAKIIYDGLKENKANLISGNCVIDYETKFNTLLNNEGGEETLNKAFQSAWDAFNYDNVDLFYIDITKMSLEKSVYSLGGIQTYSVVIKPQEGTNYFVEDFKSQTDVEKAKKYLENIKRQIVEQTSSNDAYGKIIRVHDWLISTVNYDESEALGKSIYTSYGALNNRKAVCEGYSRAFKYIMDGVDVPCVLVSGTGTNSQGQTENHAWNYVQLDNKWYAIDVTWDDPVLVNGGELTNDLKYKYFLKGSEEFLKDHKEDGSVSGAGMTFEFPTLAAGNYQKQ